MKIIIGRSDADASTAGVAARAASGGEGAGCEDGGPASAAAHGNHPQGQPVPHRLQADVT